jgi:hypothetical protein
MKDVETDKKFCSFLEKKVALFQRYLSITEQMKETLRHEEKSSLGSLIAQRRDCIQQIEKLDRYMKGIVQTGSDMRSHISGRLKGLIDGYFQTLKTLMEKLTPLDMELMVLVKHEGESLKTDLLSKQKVRQAAKSYVSFRKYPAKFLDTRR